MDKKPKATAMERADQIIEASANGHSESSEYAVRRRDALFVVLIERAIDRLTDAVKENTFALRLTKN